MTVQKFLQRVRRAPNRLGKLLAGSTPSVLKRGIRSALSREYRQNVREAKILDSIPPHTPATVPFRGRKMKIIDSGTCRFLRGEIFENEIYRFKSSQQTPYIVDCGANIGLSVMYFKTLFPRSQIVAFEPDKCVFGALEYNVRSFDLSDVTLVNKEPIRKPSLC